MRWLAVLFIALPLAAQTNLAGVGLSYAPSATPAVAGTGIYAHAVSGGTFAFTAVDLLPTATKPYSVTTQTSAGIAQRWVTLGKVGIWTPTSAGISVNGTNTGWAATFGGMATIPIGTSAMVMPAVRVVKSSVSGGTGYQVVASLMFGWGW